MVGRHSVQIEFEVLIPRDAFVAHCESVIPTMLALPGLESKVWLLSEDGRRAGGLYVFCDARAAKAYVEGPVVAALGEAEVVRVQRRLDTLESRLSELERRPAFRLLRGAQAAAAKLIRR